MRRPPLCPLLLLLLLGVAGAVPRRPLLDLNEQPDADLEEPAPEEPAEGGVAGWLERARGRAGNALKKALQLPAYFDFERFRAQFKRRYSRSEFWFRKSVFLANCVDIFKARVGYRLGQTSALQGVNKFADRSAAEMRRMFMAGPPMELKPEKQTQADYLSEMRREHALRLQNQQADLEMASQAALGGVQDDDQVSSIHEAQVQRQIELMMSQTQDNELKAAIRDELRAAQQETFSRATLDDECAQFRRPLPRPGQLRSPQSPDSKAAQVNEYTAPQFGECERIDWSEHPCFHQIYEQGESCGKCYVLASTSLAEFYKCSENEDGSFEQRKFSKDFVLECGQKFAPQTILGCLGGSMLDTLRFISLAGIYNIRGWKQRHQSELARLRESGAPLSALDQRCPLNQYETPMSEWGDIRVAMNPRVVRANEWRAALQDGPIVVSVQMPDVGLQFYAGGVHSGDHCEASGKWHAMLLVGYGTSDRGVAYWRFRNSWGADWGDAGHLNLAASLSSACLAGGVRVYREPADA